MHWWHAAHFAAWGRPWLLERSLTWYESTLGAAGATAARQGHDGARWPKQTGPDGRESPGDVGPFLIWQQPQAPSTEDPTFELAYWWWGLEVAQRWRDRRGKERSDQWRRIQDGLARPRTEKGRYCAIATEPYLLRTDHPSLLCALGLVPAAPLIDPVIMKATLLDVRDTWEWDTAWAWDFPAMAMTATRLNRPDLAVDALLADSTKNTYLPTGHCPQIGSLLPVYLPANGALLAAVSLMAAGWDEAGTDLPGFPKDGTWTVRHEGFTPWP